MVCPCLMSIGFCNSIGLARHLSLGALMCVDCNICVIYLASSTGKGVLTKPKPAYT